MVIQNQRTFKHQQQLPTTQQQSSPLPSQSQPQPQYENVIPSQAPAAMTLGSNAVGNETARADNVTPVNVTSIVGNTHAKIGEEPPEEAPMMKVTVPAAATTVNQTSNGGGPRVSFNRDVHVKRIGKRSSDIPNYDAVDNHQHHNHQTYLPPAYHQLPADLSAENIRKEAALVLAQAERHKSKAENGDNIPIFKIKRKRISDTAPNKFHSLPTRRKKATSKPVSRSNSDAAAGKKPVKRPSIFSIFSRKSDTNIAQTEGGDPRFVESGGRRLVRSKSDVGSYSGKENRRYKKLLKETKLPTTNATPTKQHSTQLSPIIENAQKEDYFEEQFNRERRKSEAITDREKHESGLNELIERSSADHRAELLEVGSLLAKNPISENIKEKILSLQAKSNENMHSSQLPVQRIPLTKGVTVNGMVKRLSMERFSPPPTISGPAFSYIRPNEGITYAQLDLSDDQQYVSPLHDMCSPVSTRQYRSPTRDITSLERTPVRRSVDQIDFVTSHPPIQTQQHQHHSNTRTNCHNSRVIIETPMHPRDSFSPVAGPTTIRISSSHSPSPWQQLSPRNLSDEDEGLGFETRRYFEEDFSSHRRSKSPPEPPIIPVIRSITPPPQPPLENGYHTRYNPTTTCHEPIDDLGYRRARLESRILTRRFGDSIKGRDYQEQRDHIPRAKSPHRIAREVRDGYQSYHVNHHQQYITPEIDEFGSRFHKPQTSEILQKYSPERSHLDIISPTPSTPTNNTIPKMEKTSRYKHTKYYDDGRGGIKEVYERETHTDGSGQPQVRESRHRERLDSTLRMVKHDDNQLGTELPQLGMGDYEPKSLDSQYTNTDQYRSSPDNSKRYDIAANGLDGRVYHHQRLTGDEHWQSSLKRDKLQQRSFDKGDSGIENDFRKESFNGDLTTRWHRRTYVDDMQDCDAFIKKERRHIEQSRQSPDRYRDTYVYRERSIDDGSHYDPHLDKYPTATSTLRRSVTSKERQTQTPPLSSTIQDTLKRSKKVGGFEKVKKLFTGGGGGPNSHSNSKKEHLEQLNNGRADSITSSVQTLPKDKYMVKEGEMRSRYREHRGSTENELDEPKITDISMRRRLSTPKASPLLMKRSPGEKKPSPLSQKNSNEKPEKSSWFKSLDRRSKNKTKNQLDVPVVTNGHIDNSSIKRSKPSRSLQQNGLAAAASPPNPSKNLRFFGDTDLDSNPPTISKATTSSKSRPAINSGLNRSQKYSKSVHHLDRLRGNNEHETSPKHFSSLEKSSMAATRHKSSSLHNLENGNMDEVDFRKRRHYSRSRDLDDISESGSETEEKYKRQNGLSGGGIAYKSHSRERLDRSHRYEHDHSYRRNNDRQNKNIVTEKESPSPPPLQAHNNSTILRKHMMGPPKPARSGERRGVSSSSLTRERERYPAESSGTEGESSLHSQRSIVYLHATTVGAIPQPYHLRRRSVSRDDLCSNKSNKYQTPLQPMTRTVSRSVSMLAPWKPKHVSEGYEINYSQEQNKQMSTLPRKQQQQQQQYQTNVTNTMIRGGKKSDATALASRSRRHELTKDDLSSLRNSSTTSASKSALSSNLHSDARRKLK